MDIKTYKVPQFSSKPVTVVCVNDIPICTVRGQKSLSDIIARLSGYDINILDGRIIKEIEKVKDKAIPDMKKLDKLEQIIQLNRTNPLVDCGLLLSEIEQILRGVDYEYPR